MMIEADEWQEWAGLRRSGEAICLAGEVIPVEEEQFALLFADRRTGRTLGILCVRHVDDWRIYFNVREESRIQPDTAFRIAGLGVVY